MTKRFLLLKSFFQIVEFGFFHHFVFLKSLRLRLRFLLFAFDAFDRLGQHLQMRLCLFRRSDLFGQNDLENVAALFQIEPFEAFDDDFAFRRQFHSAEKVS